MLYKRSCLCTCGYVHKGHKAWNYTRLNLYMYICTKNSATQLSHIYLHMFWKRVFSTLFCFCSTSFYICCFIFLNCSTEHHNKTWNRLRAFEKMAGRPKKLTWKHSSKNELRLHKNTYICAYVCLFVYTHWSSCACAFVYLCTLRPHISKCMHIHIYVYTSVRLKFTLLNQSVKHMCNTWNLKNDALSSDVK